MLWVRISIGARCTTLCDKVCQWLATGRWFSPGTPVSSTNKTDCHDITTEILLKVALNTIKQTLLQSVHLMCITATHLLICKYSLVAVLWSTNRQHWGESAALVLDGEMESTELCRMGLGLWCLTPLSVISWRSVLFVEETGWYPEKTTDPPQVTDKLYHIMLYRIQHCDEWWSRQNTIDTDRTRCWHPIVMAKCWMSRPICVLCTLSIFITILNGSRTRVSTPKMK
jgi:hypothetical protein